MISVSRSSGGVMKTTISLRAERGIGRGQVHVCSPPHWFQAPSVMICALGFATADRGHGVAGIELEGG